MKKKMKIHPMIFWGIVLFILIQVGIFSQFKTLAVIKTSATASTVCSISGNTASCSIGNYVGIECPPEYSICIDGVTADGMSAFFSANNFNPTECEYSCSFYQPWSGQSGSTGTIQGSGTNGCYGSFKKKVQYFGGNAWQVDCGVTFRGVAGTTTTTTTTQPDICHNEYECWDNSWIPQDCPTDICKNVVATDTRTEHGCEIITYSFTYYSSCIKDNVPQNCPHSGTKTKGGYDVTTVCVPATPPPVIPPTNIWDMLNNIFASIFNWIKDLLRWS